MPIDPGPTRQKLIDAATKLFAEHGVANVALAEINRAADQRNASALQYHFGGRDELLRAILRPYAETIRRRRLTLIHAIGDSASPVDDPLRTATGVLVRPIAELANGTWRDRAVVQIIADLLTDPARTYAEYDELLGERATRDMTELLITALPPMSTQILAERLRVASTFLVHASADRARLRVRAPMAALFVENLLDMMIGMLAAPVSSPTLNAISSETGN
jgi:AcrR family transcriptional regulator